MGKGGDLAPDPDEPIPLLTEPRFQPFQDSNFSVADFTSRVLGGSHTTAQAQSEELRDGVRLLDAELAREVTTKNADLLKNVRRMLDAERSLGDVMLSMESLQSAIRRIRAEITGPYDHIRSRTRQLRNLRGTVDLLRHLIHRIKLAQKLRQQMAAAPGALDLAKAAKLITDIRAVEKEVDLSDIEAVVSDEEFIRTSKQTIQAQAEAMLTEGMESMSQAKVGSALQIYFNLEELIEAVQSLISSHLTKLEKLAKVNLDARHLSAGVGAAPSPTAVGLLGMPAGPRAPMAGASSGSWQEKLWSGLKELADGIAHAATAVWHLQRVVAKKKDPLTHVCFLDELVPPDQALLTEQFWSALVRMLSEVFAAIAKPGTKSGAVRDALVAGYPKLAQTFETMFDRLMAETTMKGVPPAVGPEQLQQLLGATGPLQAAYLGSSLARMSDAVVAAFPGGTRALASATDVQRCISVLHEELKAGNTSPQMAVLSAKTAGKALELLAEKAEYMAAAGPDMRAVSVGAPANAAQLRNIALCSQLQEVHRSLIGLTSRLPPAAGQVLAVSLDHVQTTAVDTVAPMFKSVMDMLEDRIAKMHTLDFNTDTEGVTSTSPFVSDVMALISHFRSEYLSKFVPPPSPTVPSCVGSLVERMAARLLIFYMRHASLVRPLSQGGRLHIAKDMAELQLAVGASLVPLEQLGQAYKVVKAFRSLLFAEPSAVLTSPLIQELSPAIIAHHMFSRLDASVQMPHERSGLTQAQYSLWIDTHSMEEVLRGIAAALEAVTPPPTGDAAQVIVHLCLPATAASLMSSGA